MTTSTSPDTTTSTRTVPPATRTARQRVLLARPHRFIVEEMAALLARLGFEPVGRSVDGALPPLNDPATRGAIISTAVLSTVRHDHVRVFDELRAEREDLPVVFATLVPVAQYARGLASVLSRRAQPARVLTLDALGDSLPLLRPPSSVLLLDKAAVDAGGHRLEHALRLWFA